jgi:hypothetical protein
MGIWDRIGHAFVRAVEKVTGWAPPTPSAPSVDAPDFTTEPTDTTEGESYARTPETELPEGWTFEGLFHYGPSLGKEHDGRITPNTDPTDYEIAHADAIIVAFEDAFGKDYRTIHRADDRQTVALTIETQTVIISPPR